jgi:2-desacetyl-2-hydroxyethyl bacteriochlorophyllide A dehydrogenase
VRIAVVTGPDSVELRDEPIPELRPEQILVEVGACGLCTMERRLFLGERKIYPVAPGHEVAGRVVEAGSAVAELPGSPGPGQFVAVDLLTRCGTCSSCRRGRTALCKRAQGGALTDGTISMGAGLAEYVVVGAGQAWPTGDATIEQASMGEPLACVAHSVRLGRLRAGDRVAIVGAGYMGRLHLAMARAAGAGSIGVVDVSSERLGDAAGAGATWTTDPEGATDRKGEQDLVFVTAGAPGVLELAIELCDDGGTVVLYGAFPKDLSVSVGPDAIHHHELSLTGVYSHEPEDWRTAAGLIRSGTIAGDLDRLVTARYQLDDVGEAFRHIATAPTYRVLVGG